MSKITLFICTIFALLIVIYALLNLPLNDSITVVAVIVGPALGVYLTQLINVDSQIGERRLQVFRALMKDRRNPLSPDFVAGLNLIEVEFYGNKKVMDERRKLFAIFNLPSVSSSDDWPARVRERDKQTAKLLSALANSLGFKLENLDIMDDAYSPKGWFDIESEQTALRLALIKVLNNQAPITVQMETKINDQKEGI